MTSLPYLSYDQDSPQPYVNSGCRSHFFRPPTTPSASTLLAYSDYDMRTQDGAPENGHKRARVDSFQSFQSMPCSTTPGAWSTIQSGPPSAMYSSGVISPAPFVNTRYRLAGGLDTPSTAVASSYNDTEGTPDLIFRRGGQSHGSTQPPDDYFGQMPRGLDRESNGRSRVYKSKTESEGWGRIMASVVSGVAGKVWEFCKAGAFQGFHAGGSKGTTPSLYDVRTAQSSIWQDVPDGFHDSNSTSGCPANAGPDTTPPRASKRPRTDSALGGWVMVAPYSPLSHETSPSRVGPRKLPSAANAPVPRLPASSAGLRRPVLPASRPSLAHISSSHRPASSASLRSPLPSPKRASHRRTNSSAADAATARSVSPESPISAEAQRFAARVRKREKEEDRALKGFNDRLKAMIREGKEALGTRVEVEMEDLDGD